jgi:hypothetical protein
VSSGASVKTCQTLARHADPKLTIGIYAKASTLDVEAAVENLPDLTPADLEPEVMRATGTDGRVQNGTQNGTHDAEERDSERHNVLSNNGLVCVSGDPSIVGIQFSGKKDQPARAAGRREARTGTSFLIRLIEPRGRQDDPTISVKIMQSAVPQSLDVRLTIELV